MTPPGMPIKRVRHKRSPVLAHAQVLEFQSTLCGPQQARQGRRGPLDILNPPSGGQPRPGGMLYNFVAEPIIEDGLAYVSVEGHADRRAVLGAAAFQRITARGPHSPWLTRTRWWLDDEGNMRAYSLHEGRPLVHGVLVAAAILGAEAGESIEVPADPFDLRLSGLRRLD